MKLTTVLFDLDGTLLPMDYDLFVKTYFGALSKFLAPRGYEPEGLVKTIWKGTGMMVRNDGSMTNEEAFWTFFTSVYGEGSRDDIPLFEQFYRTDFAKAKDVCARNPMAAQVVGELKEAGLRTALATNPIFPVVATESRVSWAGLDMADFELVTTYENSRYCKPNPAYYRDICDAMGVKPEECLMVGNDVSDDMPAEKLGMRVFLLTDCLINKDGEDINKWPHGDFDALRSYVKAICSRREI